MALIDAYVQKLRNFVRKTGDTMQGGLTFASLTTAQRDAITKDGTVIYNTDVNKLQGREAGSWVNLV